MQEQPETPESRRGEHNEIGFRNVSEEQTYDEQGSQTPGRGEPPKDEETRRDD